MKRILSMLLAVILLFAACSTTNDPAVALNERAALVDILTLIDEQMQPGTAGSSLTAAYLAATLMDWSCSTSLEEPAITEVTQEVISHSDPNAPASFTEKLQSVYNAYESLMTEQDASILADCGYSGNGYPWSESDMTALHTIMSASEVE